jgi:ABC-2 type transport system ATP-binding protein
MILEVCGLKKTYDRTIEAVKGLNFKVHPGECVGLLGPNGAGKSTTLEMIEGVLQPSGGDVLLDGKALSYEHREILGIQFQATELLQRLTVRETLQTFSRLYRQVRPFDELVDLCELKDLLDRRATKLSGGQKQRLLLALALVNDPKIVFLDEPTTGLDPQARRSVWNTIRAIKSHGKTLILTTHYLEEAYLLCDRILIMNQGQIIAEGSPDELLKRHFSGSTFIFRSGLPDGVQLPADAIRRPSPEGRLEYFVSDPAPLLRQLLNQGFDFNAFELRSPSLEDLFLKLTGGT